MHHPALLPCCTPLLSYGLRLDHPESHALEYKAIALPASQGSVVRLKAAVCAFLNSRGGTIILGVRQTPTKQSRVQGVALYDKRDLAYLQRQLLTGFQPILCNQEVTFQTNKLSMDPAQKPTRVVVKIRVRPTQPCIYGFYSTIDSSSSDFLIYKREWTESRLLQTADQIYGLVKDRARRSAPLGLLHDCEKTVRQLSPGSYSPIESSTE